MAENTPVDADRENRPVGDVDLPDPTYAAPTFATTVEEHRRPLVIESDFPQSISRPGHDTVAAQRVTEGVARQLSNDERDAVAGAGLINLTDPQPGQTLRGHPSFPADARTTRITVGGRRFAVNPDTGILLDEIDIEDDPAEDGKSDVRSTPGRRDGTTDAVAFKP